MANKDTTFGYHPVGTHTCLCKQEVGNPARTQHNPVLGCRVMLMMTYSLLILCSIIALSAWSVLDIFWFHLCSCIVLLHWFCWHQLTAFASKPITICQFAWTLVFTSCISIAELLTMSFSGEHLSNLTVYRIRGTVIKTVLCWVVCDSMTLLPEFSSFASVFRHILFLCPCPPLVVGIKQCCDPSTCLCPMPLAQKWCISGLWLL